MPHVTRRNLHAYQNRGLDLRLAVVTSETTGSFTAITFRAGTTEKTGLSATDTESGFDVDLTLTAEDLATVGTFRWELLATINGEVRTIGQGALTVSPEPTEEAS